MQLNSHGKPRKCVPANREKTVWLTSQGWPESTIIFSVSYDTLTPRFDGWCKSSHITVFWLKTWGRRWLY